MTGWARMGAIITAGSMILLLVVAIYQFSFETYRGDWWDIPYFVALLVMLVYREAHKGSLTAEGIKVKNGERAICFAAIKQITGSYCNFTPVNLKVLSLEISVSGQQKGRYRVGLTGREVVRLSRQRMNDWEINGNKLVASAKTSDKLQVRYEPVGKFAFESSIAVFAVPFAAICIAALFVSTSFPGMSWLSLAGLLLAALVLYVVQMEILPVGAMITGDGISRIDHEGRARFLPFGDITGVERGFFSIRVTGRGGTLHFPRGLYLLAEFVEEYAGLAEKIA